MADIKVYAFEIYNKMHGIYRRAQGMCTAEDVSKIDNAKIIESIFCVIDESKLTQSRRYYPEEEAQSDK